MSTSAQLARQWWDTLHPADRQRVWDSRHSYLAGDLVESMANAGVPVVSDGHLVVHQRRTYRLHCAQLRSATPPGIVPDAQRKQSVRKRVGHQRDDDHL